MQAGTFICEVHAVFLSTEEVYTPSTMWHSALRRAADEIQQLEEKYVNKLKCHNVSLCHRTIRPRAACGSTCIT